MRLIDSRKRYPLIDLLRGIATFLMLIFHLCYDLNYFRFISINLQQDFWYFFPRFIVFLFLLCVGISQRLTHKKGIQWSKVFLRTFIIGGWSLLISLTTYFLFPGQWIYFGTLHCIAVTSLLSLCFLKIPRIAFLLGVIILLNFFWDPFSLPQAQEGFFPSPLLFVTSMDYIPLYPWFGAVLVGIFLEPLLIDQEFLLRFRLRSRLNKPDFFPSFPSRVFLFLGKKSLPIYIMHQPIFFAFLYLLSFLLSS